MHNGIHIVENEWIGLPDGRRLAARRWMPDGDGPFPAILEYLPYRKRDGTAARDATTHAVFAAAGYACIRVDIAGTGDSDGRFDDEYSEQELTDGEAVLAWIARQDWCDGAIGMIGISWGGFNGLQLAYRRPPALRAIVTVASTTDRYADDIHFMGGCLLSDNASWAGQMQAYLSRPADPLLRADWRENWLARIDDLPVLAANWLAHPRRDTFWKHGSVCEDWSRIETPVLAITGWADAYVNTPLALVENLNAPAKALIGPWEHRYPHISRLDAADFHGEVIAWFDHWLKGRDNGVAELPDMRTFMQEHFDPTAALKQRRGRWIAEPVWPSPDVTYRRLHLADGALVDTPVRGTSRVANPAHLGLHSGWFCPGMRIDNELAGDQAPDDALSCCFDLDLDDALEILGRPKLTIAFSADRPVAQIVARLCDVSPEGVSQRISYRPLNLTHHAGHDAAESLIPGQRYTAAIDLNACAHRLRPGHRLRLALSTSYWPIVWPAPEPVTLTLHLDGCHLQLPVRKSKADIAPQAPGPAQDFPTLAVDAIREASAELSITERQDGKVELLAVDDFGKSRDPGHGLITGSQVTGRYAIHPDDPASATFETAWQFTFERGDWQVTVDTTLAMSGDAQSFYLHQSLRATEADNSEILTREWDRTIPRDHL